MLQFDETQYEQLWTKTIARQPPAAIEYFTYHKARYRELFQALAFYAPANPTPRVLEVGVSGFLPFYKQLFPDLRLTTMDRPVALHGADRTYCINECLAEQAYNFDLNEALLAPTLGDPPLGAFDLVICTEVIEHLLVHPGEFIGGLLALLNPQGYLYLTTPNFFSYAKLSQMLNDCHPMAVYPKQGQNQDHGHHFREYTLTELKNYTKEAGGVIVAATFSTCWDDDQLRQRVLQEYPELATNLVLVAARTQFDGLKPGPIVSPRPIRKLLQAHNLDTKTPDFLFRIKQRLRSLAG